MSFFSSSSLMDKVHPIRHNRTMDKLSDFENTLKLLKDGEIVRILKPKPLVFAMKGDKIQAKNDQSRIFMTLDVFCELFAEAEFFRYDKGNDDEIDKTKDEDYYRWRHK